MYNHIFTVHYSNIFFYHKTVFFSSKFVVYCSSLKITETLLYICTSYLKRIFLFVLRNTLTQANRFNRFFFFAKTNVKIIRKHRRCIVQGVVYNNIKTLNLIVHPRNEADPSGFAEQHVK